MEPVRINLGLGIQVNHNVPYHERAQMILSLAKAKKLGKRKDAEGYRDDKCLVTLTGLESLIGAGAKVCELNQIGCDGAYDNLVIYEGHNFIVSSLEPTVFSIEGYLT